MFGVTGSPSYFYLSYTILLADGVSAHSSVYLVRHKHGGWDVGYIHLVVLLAKGYIYGAGSYM